MPKIEINVRDHDSLQFDIRNNTLKVIVDMLNKEYGQGTVDITKNSISQFKRSD